MNPMTTRAQSIVGTNNDGGRPLDDFYPTPPPATEALLSVESFMRNIWEPACGDGAISRVLIDQGHSVISQDLNYHGYGQPNCDFLESLDKPCDDLITNPPFRLATQFVVHAKKLGISKMALLCKLSFLEGSSRTKVLQDTKLSRVWVFSKRLTMTRNGEPSRNGGMIAFAWFVWDNTHIGPATIGWI